MGPYEYLPATPNNILFAANDSLIATGEKFDTSGWINYFAGCKLLLSVKKCSQHNFGCVGGAGFNVILKTRDIDLLQGTIFRQRSMYGWVLGGT